MIAKVYPGSISGTLPAIPSKSHVHRLLICAALSDKETTIACPALNEDIEATARCLSALGADISYDGTRFTVNPGISKQNPILNVGESGSTYRFLFPIAAALGADAAFELHGRLPARPMSELICAMESHGACISGIGSNKVIVKGTLSGGRYELPGDISSQYISALIFALPLTGADSEIILTTAVESRGYINMTLDAVRSFGIQIDWNGNTISIPGGQKYTSPGDIIAEGDWSNAAFMLCAAAACGTDVNLTGLTDKTSQGDSAVRHIIEGCGKPIQGQTISIADIPDLAPALAILACAASGETRLTDAARLRLKESDRIAAIVDTLTALGADASAGDNEIIIRGGKTLNGGTVDSCGDHRIVMMAACLAVISESPIIITRAEAVRKSYPNFFEDIRSLGLKAETY